MSIKTFVIVIFLCLGPCWAHADDVNMPAIVVYPQSSSDDFKKEIQDLNEELQKRKTKQPILPVHNPVPSPLDNLAHQADHLNAMLAKKNKQIIQLANSLKQKQEELDQIKNENFRLKQMLAMPKEKTQNVQFASRLGLELKKSQEQLAEKQQQVNLLKDELENKLDKFQEQTRLIHVLSRKLQDAELSAQANSVSQNLTKP